MNPFGVMLIAVSDRQLQKAAIAGNSLSDLLEAIPQPELRLMAQKAPFKEEGHG